MQIRAIHPLMPLLLLLLLLPIIRKLCSAGNFPPTYLSQTRNLKQAWKLRLIMKTEADDDGAVSVDFFFPVRFCFIPAGSVKFFPGFQEKIMESIVGMKIATNKGTSNNNVRFFGT